MTLDEAIHILGIEGYPTTQKVYDFNTGPVPASPEDGDAKAQRAAFTVVLEFLALLRRESAELRDAFENIAWGPGSPTEYMALHSQLSAYGGLEAREAERLGAPKGPLRPSPPGTPRIAPGVAAPQACENQGLARSAPVRYFGIPITDLYARAKSADLTTWELMQQAFDAAIDVPTAPSPPVGECIDLALRLHAAGDLTAADALTTTFARWLDGGRERPTGRAWVRWGLAFELSMASPSILPLALRVPIAEAALSGDVSQAAARVCAFCATESDEDNDVRLEGLRSDAPNIARALAVALSGTAQ